MKKKLIKGSLALTCMSAMLASSMPVFADPVTSTGNSAVENDNSVPPSYINVVLPTTIPSDTYAFTIDTEGLLKKYADSGKYDASSTVYFSNVATPASAAAKDTASGDTGFFELKEVEDTSLAKIEAELKTLKKSTLSTLTAATYYVWQPDTSTDAAKAAGKGKYTEVTGANVEEFLTLTLDTDDDTITGAAARTDNLYGDEIWDGKIYVKGYQAVSDAAPYFTVDADGVITAVASGLYVGDGTTCVAVDMTNVATKVTYTPAVIQYKNESQVATVTNKSSNPIAVNVTISFPDDNGLTFQGTTTFTGVTAAALCMQLNDGTNDTPVATTNGSTGVSEFYLLQGANATNLTYQSKEIDDKTGSHIYYQYVPTSATYSKVDFKLTAAANAEAGAKDAWTEYIKKLGSGDALKPDITVVYDFENVALDSTDAAKKTYVSEAGGKYTITTAGASEKATQVTAPSGAVTKAYGYFDDEWNLWLAVDNSEDDGGIEEAKLSNLKIGDTDGAASALSSSDYTIEYGWIKIAWDDLASYVTDGDTWSYTATFTYDGTNYSRTVTELTTGPDSE